VVKKGQGAYKEIIEFFGEDILDENRDIDRKKIGNIIFKDESLRKKLNEIVHPYIFKILKDEILRYGKVEKLIFLDIPLLIEESDSFNKHKIYFDEIWLVYIDEKTQLDRLMKRDSINEREALYRINSQMSIELKKEYANQIFDNRGDINSLEIQLDKILKEII
jgi:dephospho-CoA kinase